MQQIYLYESMVTGYARKTMNNTHITHHPDRATIEWRIKVLNFYDRYGQAATTEAFSISRSTVFLWKQKLKNNYGQLSVLAPASRAPKARRRRTTDPRISDFIIAQRTSHPRLGKDKLTALLKPYCATQGIQSPSVSTVGRILLDLKAQNRLPAYAHLSMSARTGKLLHRTNRPLLKKRRRGDYRPKVPGDLVQIDTIVNLS